MNKMPIISLPDTAKALGDSGGRVNVLWQQPDSLVFMARGREYRSEFHINPSDEVMYPVKGCLLYTSPSPRDRTRSRMPSSA